MSWRTIITRGLYPVHEPGQLEPIGEPAESPHSLYILLRPGGTSIGSLPVFHFLRHPLEDTDVSAAPSAYRDLKQVLSEEDLGIRNFAFFSRHLTSAGKNDSVWNRELLAIILALQEWIYWLKGTIHSFIVRTDHKNLSYFL